MTAPTPELLRHDTLDSAARAVLFHDARTANSFRHEPVDDETLTSIWELAKWPPTAANIQPLRVQFIRTPEGKDRLVPLMNEGNRGKTTAAPAVAVLAADVEFHQFVPELFPMRPEMRDNFEAMGVAKREELARFNATLQIGYFILSVRAHGLAAGPMAGFDADAVTEEFFPGGRYRALLVVNIGHPGENPWFPRLPRLDHDEAVRWA
jgi:3-hydroxypropanoate dehydrogenase